MKNIIKYPARNSWELFLKRQVLEKKDLRKTDKNIIKYSMILLYETFKIKYFFYYVLILPKTGFFYVSLL